MPNEKREIPLLEIVHRGSAASAASASRTKDTRSFASRALSAVRTPVYGNSTSDEASEANWSALKGALVGATVGGLVSRGDDEDPSSGPERAMMVLGGIMTVSSAVLINYELGDGGEEEYANVI